MGKFDNVILAFVLVLLAVSALALWFAPNANSRAETYNPVPGNDTCWLSLCVEEGLNTNCIRFPLGYSDCAELQYACEGIAEYRDRFAPQSKIWQEEIGFNCTYAESTCMCVKTGEGACEN